VASWRLSTFYDRLEFGEGREFDECDGFDSPPA